jgi:uncharacterized membrane protein
VTRLLVLLAVVSWVVATFLAYRLPAFRVDRMYHRGYFGELPESVTTLFSRSTYDADGQRLYPFFVIAAVLAMLMFGIAVIAVGTA